MKILIDNSMLFVGGGIQVATSFLYDLLTLDFAHEFIVVQSPNSSKQINKRDFDNRFVFYDLTEIDYNNIIKRSRFVKRIEINNNPNVIFTVFGPSYHKSMVPKVVGFAIPHLIYRDSPFFSQINVFSKLKIHLLSMFKKHQFKKNSSALIFESKAAMDRFKSDFDGETHVVSNTLNQIFNNKDQWKDFIVGDKKGFNILCLTANYPHKNLMIIPKVIDHLLSLEFFNFKFLLSINKEDVKIEERYLPYIEFLGKVDLNCLPSLYQQMDLLFMPSLLEVFSTTYLEAMFMKVPILASDMPFARDICGEKGAIFVSPLSSSDYAQAIIKLKNDAILREKLIFNGLDNLKRFGNSLERTKSYIKILESYDKA